MTLLAYTPARYTGNNTTPTYSFSFRIFQNADLVVIRTDLSGVETTLILGTDYTVTGAGSYTGGSITLTAGNLATGFKLTLKRVVAITQETSIRNQTAFYASVHEDEFDKLTAIDQQQQEQLDRSFKLAPGSTDSPDLPSASEGSVLGWVSGKLANLSAASAQLAADLLSTATNKGATLIGYLSPLAGAVTQLVSEVLNTNVSVKTFGAVGDGVADDSAAVAAAIATGIGRIYYPPGTYKITNVTLASFQTHYGPGATITSSGSAFILPAGATQHITFDGHTFSGTGNAIYTDGVYLNASWVIKNCSFGRTLAECIHVPLILSSIKYNHFGTNNGALGAQHRHLYMAATAASGVAINENQIIGNRFNYAKGALASTFIQYGSGNTFTGNDWEGNTSDKTVHIDGGGISNFYGNWFESNSSVQQVYMEASAAITATIYYNSAVNFVGNVCNLLVAGNAALFYLDANSYHLSMVGNMLYTNITPTGTVKVSNSPAGDNGGVVEFRRNVNYGNTFGITGLYDFAGDLHLGAKVFAGGTTAADGVIVGKGIGAAKLINLVNTTDATAFYVGNTGQVSTGALADSPYNSTTASAANLFVASNGIFQRSTSAAKYKTDVRDLESLDITKLRAVRYKSLGSSDDPALDHFGLIADEALEAGFTELVTLGDDGQPEGFQYERLTAVLLKDLQDLRKEFAEYKTGHP